MKAKVLFKDAYPGSLPADLEDAYMAALIIVQTKAWSYYSILLDLQIIWTRGVRTAGTDGVYVYINPEFFLRLPTHGQRAFLLAHEVGHVIFRHPARGMFFRKRGFHSMQHGKPLPFNHRTYNVAADYVINADLLAYGFEKIPAGLFHNDFNRDHLVDNVYIQIMGQREQEQEQAEQPDLPEDWDDLSEEDSDDPAEPWGEDEAEGEDEDDLEDQSDDSEGEAEGSGEDGSGDGDETADVDMSPEDMDGEPEPSDHGGHDDHFEPQYEGTEEEVREAMEADRDEIQRKVDDALESAEDMDKGCGPSGAMSAQGYRHNGGAASSTDWRTALADRFMRNGTGGDITYSRINRRRYAQLRIIAPSRIGTFNQIAFIIDCSGSVCPDAYAKAALEVAAMIDLLQPASGCLVLFCTTRIEAMHEVYSGSELLDLDLPRVGGGTRMASGLDFLEEHGLQPDVTVCFTDGDLPHNDWPALATANALVVLDSQPSAWTLQYIANAGVDYVVVEDDGVLAA